MKEQCGKTSKLKTCRVGRAVDRRSSRYGFDKATRTRSRRGKNEGKVNDAVRQLRPDGTVVVCVEYLKPRDVLPRAQDAQVFIDGAGSHEKRGDL
jgi:hypothetical protein